jgi:glycosyltransferase involved in cell wall biosynthesis
MRICQVVTGLIPIPNNRWGATEKVMWNYKIYLEKRGLLCDVLYLNDVDKSKYDIVHIHMANLAIEAKKRGIPYVFSIHDHHAEYHGEGSYVYNQNLEAIKGSIFSITHAEHYIDLFHGTDKLFYLSHGVDNQFFKRTNTSFLRGYNILMVANNGLAGDFSIDRKGFLHGINAAKELDLPITIIGAEANRKFFELHPDILQSYDRITIHDDNPTDDFILSAYNSHKIFLHPSFLEAGHPNLTLLEAMSCNLEIVAAYKGSQSIPRLVKIENLTTSDVVEGIKKAISNHQNNSHVKYDFEQLRYDWAAITSTLHKMYSYVLCNKQTNDSKIVKDKYLNCYASFED